MTRQIQRYVRRISGPLLDQIDIHIDVPAVKFREPSGDTHPETDSSTTIRNRVIAARERQLKRFASEKIFSNAAMTPLHHCDHFDGMTLINNSSTGCSRIGDIFKSTHLASVRCT